jgi:hypothetical protein
MMERILEAAVGSLGYRVERKTPTQVVAPAPEYGPDFTPQEQEIWHSAEHCPMTSRNEPHESGAAR